MESYKFMVRGVEHVVRKNWVQVQGAEEDPGATTAALCAEILRLAEEREELAQAAGRQVAAALANVAIQEQHSTIVSLWSRLKRRKAKIRKLKKELSVIGHRLEAARVLSAQAEREAVLAYLERWKIYGYMPVAEVSRLIRSGAHLTAPASPPQEPLPSGESARG